MVWARGVWGFRIYGGQSSGVRILSSSGGFAVESFSGCCSGVEGFGLNYGGRCVAS